MKARNTLLVTGFLAASLVLANPAMADFDAGKEAFENGNFATAYTEFMAEANQGNATAQGFLGFMYLTGRGVKKDGKAALHWYTVSANQGDATSQYHVGVILSNGDGVKKNKKEAVKWYQMAADQGLIPAQNALGYVYENGKGVKKNREEAARWYRLAADQGDRSAQRSMGRLFEKGRGVEKDKAEAERWFRLAAEDETGRSQFALGDFLARQRGITSRSLSTGALTKAPGYKYKFKGSDEKQIEGFMWLSLAAAQGNDAAHAKLYELRDRFEPDTLFKAERLAYETLGNDKMLQMLALGDSGDAEAQYGLGMLYARGYRAATNKEDAAFWDDLAEQAGVVENLYFAYHWLILAELNSGEGLKEPGRACKNLIKITEDVDEMDIGPGPDWARSNGQQFIAIAHFEAHPEAFPDGSIKKVFRNLCGQ